MSTDRILEQRESTEPKHADSPARRGTDAHEVGAHETQLYGMSLIGLQSIAGNEAVNLLVQGSRRDGNPKALGDGPAQGNALTSGSLVSSTGSTPQGMPLQRRNKADTGVEAEPGADGEIAIDRASSLLDELAGPLVVVSGPDVAGLEPEVADIFWDFWKAATGRQYVGGKETRAYSDQRLRSVLLGEQKINRLISAYARVSPKKAEQYRKSIEQDIHVIRVRVYADQASERVGDVTDEQVAGLDPELRAEKVRLLETVHTATETLSKLNETASQIDKATLERDFKRFKGSTFEDSGLFKGLERCGKVLDLINIAISIADTKKRDETNEELRRQLGPGSEHSTAGAAATATEMYHDWLKAVSLVAEFGLKGAGIIAKYRGLIEQSKECFEAAEHVSNALGGVLSALEIAHGVLVLCDSTASLEKKADATVEIYSGTVGLLAAGEVISGAAAAELTIPITVTWQEFKWSLQIGADFIKYAFIIDLKNSYHLLRDAGNEVAPHLIRTQMLHDVSRQVHGKEQAQGYQLELKQSLFPLQDAISKAANLWGAGVPQAALRKRAAPLQQVINAAMDRNATAEMVIAAGNALLNEMMEAVKAFDDVLRDTFRENGYSVPEQKGSESPKVAAPAPTE